MPAMRLREWFTLFWILALLPAAAIGSYLAYAQAGERVREMNQITPLHETDLQNTIQLILNLEDPESVEEAPLTAPDVPALTVQEATPTAVPFAVEVEGTPEAPIAEGTAGSAEAAEAAPIPEEALVITDPRRVNVLLMGIDQREGEEGQFRTDTMIVMSIDPVGRTGAMLSIPRDLWVSIPGGLGEGRINTANYIGDDPSLNYPGGGPALAMAAIEKVIGQPIHHYVLVNFSAFTTIIDTVGAIEVCPPEAIDDPKYPDGSYGFNPIYIEAGCQAMEGERLLQYARTRATSGGDFDRAARQQEVILAVRDRILSLDGGRALLGDALTIWESVSANIKTDMTLDEMLELALLAREVVEIRNGTIGTGEVLQSVAPDGSEILVPIQTDILALVADLFRPPNTPAQRPEENAAASEPETSAPAITLNPDELPMQVRQEAPIIVLLNATSIQGRAARLRDHLFSYSLDVGVIGNHTSADVVETYIIYTGEHEFSAQYLAQVIALVNNGVAPRIEFRDENRDDGDVIVLIGTDLQLPEGAPE